VTIRYALCVTTPPSAPGAPRSRLKGSSSYADPSMIMPLPNVSCAWAIPPRSSGTTKRCSNPNARHSHSMAAAAS
jgi:hypothetical protein